MGALQSLLVQAGYPAFPLDERGFPELGPVIKYFRKQMVYTDLDGCERRWTQLDLAEALGLSEDMVGLMETKNSGEELFSRRHALAEVLNIPPVFLGIGILADLEAFLQTCGIAQSQGASIINENEVSLYQDALELHWDKYYAGTLQNISTLQYWLRRIELAVREHSAYQQSLESLICEYSQLLAKVHTDKRQYTEAFTYLDDGQDIASSLGNKALQAAIFYRQAYARLGQRKFALAKVPVDMAVSLAQDADKSLRGEIYQTAGLTYALTAQDKKDRAKAKEFLDLAGKIADDEATLGEDVYHVRFNSGYYRSRRADILIALGEPTNALKELDKADEQLPFDQRRRRGYMQVLQAKAYMKQKNPQLDIATDHLQIAFDVSSAIHANYHIDYITRLCKELSNSSYGNSPAVAKLKRLLREYKEKQVKM